MNALSRIQGQLASTELDLLRLCVWLVLLVAILVPLERIFSLHPQKTFRRGFLPDLAYYFLNGLLPKLLLVVPVAAGAWALHFLVPAGVRTYMAAMPLGVRFPASLIVGEIGYYWGHRWSHEIPFLWRFHAVHHSAEELDWLVNTRAHPVDLVFTRLCGFVPMYVLGLVRPGGGSLDVVTSLVILTGTMWGFFIHSNLRWRFGPLEWLFSTPAFHHWHHTSEAPLNRNFAPMLPWVDRIFGTYYQPAEWPSRYGVPGYAASGMAEELFSPLMPREPVPSLAPGPSPSQ
jgi:sterol desaturase/sphingolipid hydroxylase (fatty acid hydroxylase superfamily)